MKKGTHPKYRPVVFLDMASGFMFLTRSTVTTFEEVNFNDKIYPLVKIEVSAESHPFYTGQQRIVDTAKRVDRFHRKYGKLLPSLTTQ